MASDTVRLAVAPRHNILYYIAANTCLPTVLSLPPLVSSESRGSDSLGKIFSDISLTRGHTPTSLSHLATAAVRH